MGGYVGSTMMYETFFTEEPEAPGWRQVDERGRPIYYPRDQTFRYAACRNNPGYWAFLEKVLRLGIEDLRLDLIHFDQMSWWREPESCRCRFCAARFREWLLEKYPPAARRLRFGFGRLDAVAPPPPGASPALNNPLMQEWALWRAAELARHFAAFDRFIHSLNPDVALEGNPNLNPAANLGYRVGFDAATMLEHGDIVWSEEPAHASWTPDGRLVSKIRSFKAARIMGKSIFVYTGGRYGAQDPASPPHLRIAEAMAYNGNNIGMVGDVHPEGIELTAEARRYIEFFHRHNRGLAGTEPVGDVAVLRSFPAVEFNPSRALVAAVLAEQTLIQHHVPFDIVFNRHLRDLARYKVLLLADQDALSDEEAAAIRGFVESGGGLVATGSTSLLTNWRLERRKPALADVLGVDLPLEQGPPVRRQFGRGRVVYIPRIVPAIEPPEPGIVYNFSHKHWKLPVNHAELADAVRWAAQGELSAVVRAPQHVAIELTRQKESGNTNLHLVNFDPRRPVDNIEASVRIPSGLRLREAALATPDQAAARPLRAAAEGGVVRLRIPRLQVYGLVMLRWEK